jgi:hypothetical protein
MRRGGISRARVAYDLLQDSPNRVICTRRAAAALAHRAARIRRPAWLLDAEQAFLFAVRSRASGLRGIGVACRVMGSRHSVRCRRRAGQCCWRDGESRLVRGGSSQAFVWSGAGRFAGALRCGGVPPLGRDRRVYGGRPDAGSARRAVEVLARSGCGQMSLAVRVFALTQRQHKPGARAKINTEVTRTKRHSPSRDGTTAKMSV